MGYHVVDPDAITPTPDRPCERRSVSESVDLDRLAVNLYRAEPGEQVPLAYHYHDQQEEVFYVLEGPAAVETPEETFAVERGQVFVVEPGHPHRLHNPASAAGSIEVLAIGAPSIDDGHSYEP